MQSFTAITAITAVTAILLLAGCVVVPEDSSPGNDYGSTASVPSIDLNRSDNAATVRFRNGREVLFAPNGQMVKWSPGTTEAEKAAARRAYQAALNEKTADFNDV